jgi:hypothetical protein
VFFLFFYTFLWDISHSKKNLTSFYHNVQKCSYKVPLIFNWIN